MLNHNDFKKIIAHKNLPELIKVMEAFYSGDKIEFCYSDGKWGEYFHSNDALHVPDFLHEGVQWRIQEKTTKVEWIKTSEKNPPKTGYYLTSHQNVTKLYFVIGSGWYVNEYSPYNAKIDVTHWTYLPQAPE